VHKCSRAVVSAVITFTAFEDTRRVHFRALPVLFLLLVTIPAFRGQTAVAGMAGTVVDAKTGKPVPAALVMAVQTGLPPLSTRTGGDGAFQIDGLAAGKYSLCVQAQSDGYLDPCQWNGSPMTVTVVSGQAATGVVLRLTPASALNIQVLDSQKVLTQATKDGRRPELTVGVWGPDGLYYPAHAWSNVGDAESISGGVLYRWGFRGTRPSSSASRAETSGSGMPPA